jgi:large subunit ribosomal protein L15
MRLNNFKTAANEDKKRLGRGIGSGKGKTSGKGHKGQKARSNAKSMKTFEGGQTPIYRRLPKQGFNHHVDTKVEAVTTDLILSLIESGKLTDVVTKEDLIKIGAVHKDSIVKLLQGEKDVRDSIKVEVDRYSKGAEKYKR